ncbi:MAG: nucleotidyltransferase domain-containing protein [Anaerolineae bacterium]
MLSAENHGYLSILQDIDAVSAACGTRTYIWGGFTIDILTGRFIRAHHDLDGFTQNLLDVLPEMMARYAARGYATEFRDDIDMLTIRKGDTHAAFNRLEIDGPIAMCRHIGNEGTVYFPVEWLDAAPRDFYGVNVYTAGIQLDYALKTNIRMIHATWTLREHDHAAIAAMERMLAERALDPEDFLRHVWSFNPFWVKQGYAQYALPAVARPLQPL